MISLASYFLKGDKMRDTNLSDDAIIDQAAVGELLNKSPRTIEIWRGKGIGPPFVKIGRTVGYRLGAVREWLRTSEYSSTAEARRARKALTPSTDLHTP